MKLSYQFESQIEGKTQRPQHKVCLFGTLTAEASEKLLALTANSGQPGKWILDFSGVQGIDSGGANALAQFCASLSANPDRHAERQEQEKENQPSEQKVWKIIGASDRQLALLRFVGIADSSSAIVPMPQERDSAHTNLA